MSPFHWKCVGEQEKQVVTSIYFLLALTKHFKPLEEWSLPSRDTKQHNTCTYLHNSQQPAFSNNSTIQSSSSRYDESTICTATIIILHRWYTTSTLLHDRSFALFHQWREFAHICGMSRWLVARRGIYRSDASLQTNQNTSSANSATTLANKRGRISFSHRGSAPSFAESTSLLYSHAGIVHNFLQKVWSWLLALVKIQTLPQTHQRIWFESFTIVNLSNSFSPFLICSMNQTTISSRLAIPPRDLFTTCKY